MDILSFLGENQGAQFALIASTVGPVFYRFSSQISGFFTKLKNLCFYNVTIHYSDVASKRLSVWLSQHPEAIKFANYVRLETRERGTNAFDEEYYDNEEKVTWRYVPNYGTFFMKPEGYPLMLLHRESDNADKKEVLIPTDIFTISSFLWNKKKLREFVNEVKNFSIEYAKKTKEPRLHYWYYHDFADMMPIESSGKYELLSDELKFVYDDIVNFFSEETEKRNARKGIKHKRGYLLHGVPGTGKSEFIAFVAKSLNKNIYYIAAEDIDKFKNMISQIEKGSIIVLEDWDNFAVSKRNLDDEKDELRILGKQDTFEKNNLSNLLNAMDGIGSYSGSIIIATTNDIKSIDDALIRAGRMDVVTEVKPLGTDLVLKHAERFYEISGLSCDQDLTITVAELYNHFKMCSLEEFCEKFGIKQSAE